MLQTVAREGMEGGGGLLYCRKFPQKPNDMVSQQDCGHPSGCVNINLAIVVVLISFFQFLEPVYLTFCALQHNKVF